MRDISGMTRQKILRMRKFGFRIWAIARETRLPYNAVAKVLYEHGESLRHIDHPRQRSQCTKN